MYCQAVYVSCVAEAFLPAIIPSGDAPALYVAIISIEANAPAVSLTFSPNVLCCNGTEALL